MRERRNGDPGPRSRGPTTGLSALPFRFSQPLRQGSVAFALRNLRRSVAAFVNDCVVGFGLKQQLDHRFSAVDRGPVEGGPPVVVHCVWLGFGLKQLSGNAFVAFFRGTVKCSSAI